MEQCSTGNLEFRYTRLTLSRKIRQTSKNGHAQSGDKPKVFIQVSDSKLILLHRTFLRFFFLNDDVVWCSYCFFVLAVDCLFRSRLCSSGIALAQFDRVWCSLVQQASTTSILIFSTIALDLFDIIHVLFKVLRNKEATRSIPVYHFIEGTWHPHILYQIQAMMVPASDPLSCTRMQCHSDQLLIVVSGLSMRE